MTRRPYNFSAGPATLPEPVLEQARDELVSLPGVGMSVLEISHRSKTFDDIIRGAEAAIRELASIPDDYKVLFLPGGASLQFSMVPMNLLPKNGSADYVVTGSWSKKAVKEAKKVGGVNVAASTEDENFCRIPSPSELKLDPKAAYLHFTTNNTIFGTQWKFEPESAVTLVADVSSDIFSRPIDVSKYDLIYAGAQKNLGPAGVTLVIFRDALLERVPEGLPSMLDYKIHSKGRSLYNTPPVFSIYMVGLVMKWVAGQGGLETMGRHNAAKAKLVYDVIDGSNGFYRAHAKPDSRSDMNIAFRLPTEELEAKFLDESKTAGFSGLKGHRSVGGLRASVYNAFPRKGVEALTSFMEEFQRTNG